MFRIFVAILQTQKNKMQLISSTEGTKPPQLKV